MIELTDRMLNIPAAVAHKYARGNCSLAEELESVCNLEFTLAWRSFDPTRHPAGDNGLASWLMRIVVLRARRWLKRQRRRGEISLDALAGEGRAADLARDDTQPDTPVQAAEMAAQALRRLRPRERAAVLLHYRDGLAFALVGERLGGLSGERARQIIGGAVARLRRSALTDVNPGRQRRRKGDAAALIAWQRANPALAVAARNHGRRESGRRSKEAARARCALGHVYTNAYYLADDAVRTLTGAYPSAAAAARDAGGRVPSGVAAAVLAAGLAAGLPQPFTAAQAAAALMCPVGHVRSAVTRLVALGFLQVAGDVPSGRKGGRRPWLYRQVKATPPRVVCGRQARQLAAQGYQVCQRGGWCV